MARQSENVMRQLREYVRKECERLKKECFDYRDAKTYLPEVIQDTEREFPYTKGVSNIVQDILRDVFEDD
jgi:hypothetical protein